MTSIDIVRGAPEAEQRDAGVLPKPLPQREALELVATLIAMLVVILVLAVTIGASPPGYQ